MIIRWNIIQIRIINITKSVYDSLSCLKVWGLKDVLHSFWILAVLIHFRLHFFK